MAIDTHDSSWWSGLVDWIADFAFDMLLGFFTWIVECAFYLYDKFLNLFASIINNFPIPDSWANSDPWANFSPQVLYLLDKFMIVEVLAIISAGWTIRFMLNRIPFLKL